MTQRSIPHDDADLGELFHAAFRGLRHTWAEQLAPYGLTPHQFRALQSLLRRGGPGGGCAEGGTGGMRLKDIAARLRIAPRSATEVIDQLEAKALVTRAPAPDDRRATLVSATDAGLDLWRRLTTARRELANEYFAKLEPADRAELKRILRLLG
ncbi:MarR family winged helix-turn-helix transcriptional regulator [Paeniglutamicibacter cryotolerans]|uniref:DNA-binding MarR family transcriptional regulator n=1 Tax=Paeniglutamicibacter cryotolerans TaxID=670079 RepID=A0A839QMF9_9MICC|nr:MarR family transcriptional regulator [Paeniglutamicibacter cryotolerans]MBB2994392.1 DNA-binding MarR family transcriptional regulator [Paeniglutamicibacter cryotolerans]